jgi:uncharacterized protein (DUF2461 family)
MSGFNGFPPQAVAFFQELKLNSNKSWFDAHKTVY